MAARRTDAVLSNKQQPGFGLKTTAGKKGVRSNSWLEIEETFIFGAIVHKYLEKGYLFKSANTTPPLRHGKKRPPKAKKTKNPKGETAQVTTWAEIKVLYDLIWERFEKREGESVPCSRTATAIARHYKVMKGRLSQSQNYFHILYEKWRIVYNIDNTLLSHKKDFTTKQDNIVLKNIADGKEIKKPEWKTFRMDKWTHDEEVILIGSVMERFLDKGSLVSARKPGLGRENEQDCWNTIKEKFDASYKQLAEMKKVHCSRRDRTQTAMSAAYKKMKRRIEKTKGKDHLVYYFDEWRERFLPHIKDRTVLLMEAKKLLDQKKPKTPHFKSDEKYNNDKTNQKLGNYNAILPGSINVKLAGCIGAKRKRINAHPNQLNLNKNLIMHKMSPTVSLMGTEKSNTYSEMPINLTLNALRQQALLGTNSSANMCLPGVDMKKPKINTQNVPVGNKFSQLQFNKKNFQKQSLHDYNHAKQQRINACNSLPNGPSLQMMAPLLATAGPFDAMNGQILRGNFSNMANILPISPTNAQSQTLAPQQISTDSKNNEIAALAQVAQNRTQAQSNAIFHNIMQQALSNASSLTSKTQDASSSLSQTWMNAQKVTTLSPGNVAAGLVTGNNTEQTKVSINTTRNDTYAKQTENLNSIFSSSEGTSTTGQATSLNEMLKYVEDAENSLKHLGYTIVPSEDEKQEYLKKVQESLKQLGYDVIPVDKN